MKVHTLHTTALRHYGYSLSSLLLLMLMSIQAWAIPPSITLQPTNKSICDGANTTFSVSATNTTSYRWQIDNGGGFVDLFDGGVYSNAGTNILTITGATAAMSGIQYRCVATGPDNPPATSNAASLTVNTEAMIVTQPTTSITICSGGNASYTVVTTGTVSSYQWYGHNGVSYVSIPNGGFYSGTNTATLNITGITPGPGAYTSYFCAINSPCGSKTTAPSYLTINTAPAITTSPTNKSVCNGFATSFNVAATGTNLTYQWQYSANGINWLTAINGAIYSGATTSQLTVTANMSLNNFKYRCVVSGTCTPPAASASGTLTVLSTVAVTNHPVDKVVCPGNNTFYRVAASGAGLNYQWQINRNDGNGFVNLANGGIYSGATTNELNLTAVTLNEDNYLFRCLVTGTCPSQAFSNYAKLDVPVPVAITAQPVVSQTICNGGNASYSVSATGDGISYEWYMQVGNQYVPMTDGGFYSGTQTNTLNITGITTGNPTATTYSYFCAVWGSCASKSTVPVYLTVNALPAITANPTNKSVCNGYSTSFNVSATGTGLTYQWQMSANNINWNTLSNNATYSGVNTSQLNVLANQSLQNLKYRCVVSGTCAPSVNSAAGTLTILFPIAITTNPVDQTACPGENAKFRTAASGTGVTYQWQVNKNDGNGFVNLTNGGLYSGVTAQELNITGVTLAEDGYLYRCYITGTCPSIDYSDIAKLTVPEPVAIVTAPTPAGPICSGGNASYTVTATGDGLSYEWYMHNGTQYVAMTDGGVYSGTQTNTLNITGITTGATATTYSYFCAVKGACYGKTTAPLYLTVNALPAVTMHPQDVASCKGFDVYYSVTGTGTGLTYQWQLSTNNGVSWSNLANNATYSNVTTSQLKVNAQASMNNYMYRCVVGGTCAPAVNSNGAKLTILEEPMITSQPMATVVCSGGNTSFTVAATGANLTYQWQAFSNGGWANIANGGIYSNVTTATLNITGATTGMSYRCLVSGTCQPAVYSQPAALTVQTAPAVTMSPTNKAVCPGGNTTFSVTATGTGLMYQWEVNAGSGWSVLVNGGMVSGAMSSTLMLTGVSIADNNKQYRCVVSGTCPTPATSAAATLTINSVPAINTQPMASVICLNGNTSFSVGATGTGVMYQWQSSFNGGSTWTNISNAAPYSGATTAMLSVTAAPSTINGYLYRCVVSGTCTPSQNSNAVMLTVNNPTAVNTHPANKTVCPSNANATFSVAASGAGLGYQWEVNTGSGWSSVNNGGVYAGATTATLSLSNIPQSYNANQYRCVVTGTCAPLSVTSNAATLTVNADVVITTQPSSSTTICHGGNTSLTVVATGTNMAYQWYMFNGTSYVAMTNNATYAGVNTATLGITALSSNNGAARTYSYYCVITGACLGATTSPSVVTVNALPNVTSNPLNKVMCDSTKDAKFNIVATGTNLTYQWQVNTGSGWNNIPVDTMTAGVTTNELTLKYVYASMHNNQYRCVVSGACTPQATSAAGVLTVNSLTHPAVTVAANFNNVCAGIPLTFTATPTDGGTTPLYRWKVNGTVVTGLTTNSSYIATLNNGEFVSCEMTSNAICPVPTIPVQSNGVTAIITSYQQPTVTVTNNVQNNTACSGVPVTFSTATTFGGSAPTYQWQVNGANINNATTPTYVTDSLDDNDVVRCIMNSTFMCPLNSTVSSNNVTMDINQTTPATVSISSTYDTTVCKGHAVKLNAYYTNSGINPQFQWYKNGGPIAGATGASFTTSTIYDNDYIQCQFISSAQCVFPVLSDSLMFTVDEEVYPYVNVTVLDNGGGKYTFTALPKNGGASPTYEWYVNGSKINGVTGPVFISSAVKRSDNVHVIMYSTHPCVVYTKASSRFITTGIEDEQLGMNSFTLFPNPNTGKFTIAGDYNVTGTKEAKIAILNSLGQVIHMETATINGGKLNHIVNLNTEPAAGMYMIRLEVDGKTDLKRFSIAK